MRFAGGAFGVSWPTTCSLLVMALPCFVLFLCDLEREEIERKIPHGILQHTDEFFPGLGNHAQTVVKNRMSCRVMLYKGKFTVNMERL